MGFKDIRKQLYRLKNLTDTHEVRLNNAGDATYQLHLRIQDLEAQFDKLQDDMDLVFGHLGLTDEDPNPVDLFPDEDADDDEVLRFIESIRSAYYEAPSCGPQGCSV